MTLKLIPFSIPKTELFGFVTPSQKVVIEPKFSFATASAEGIALAQMAQDSPLILIDAKTYEQYQLPVGIEAFSSFSNGVLSVENEIMGQKRYGFADNKGGVVISPKFAWSSNMDSKGAVVKVAPTDKFHRRIDQTGTVVGDRFLQITPFHRFGVMGGATIDWHGNQRMVVINGEGKQVSNSTFRSVRQENEGLIPVVYSDESVGWVNKEVEEVKKFKGSDVGFHFQSRVIPVKDKNLKWGLMNPEGKWIVEPEYDICEAVGTNRFRVGWLDKKRERQVRLVDACGHFVGHQIFDDIYEFSEDIALVTRRLKDNRKEEFDGYREENYIDIQGNLLLDKWNQ